MTNHFKAIGELRRGLIRLLKMRVWVAERLRPSAMQATLLWAGVVACGAAAGIASAYNAPIAGAQFVAEIVLGSISMENFVPLVFSSVVGTLTVRELLGGNPLYDTRHSNSAHFEKCRRIWRWGCWRDWLPHGSCGCCG